MTDKLIYFNSPLTQENFKIDLCVNSLLSSGCSALSLPLRTLRTNYFFIQMKQTKSLSFSLQHVAKQQTL